MINSSLEITNKEKVNIEKAATSIKAKCSMVFCFLVVLCALCSMCAVGCTAGNQTSKAAQTDQVAASVLDQDITEQMVVDYIDSFRNTMGYTDDDSWAQYLEKQNTTPEKLRSATIYELAGDVVINKKAEELGVIVEDSEIDSEIAKFRESLYATDDDTWESTLETYKTNEEDLRARYKQNLLQEKVYKAVVGDVSATDADMNSYISENLLGTTTKKFIAIYGTAYTELQSVLETLKKAQSLPEAIEDVKNSANQTSVIYEEFGWDIDSETTTSMKTELSDLDVGALSKNLVSDENVGAYEILYVQDKYTFPTEGADVNNCPADLKTMVGKLAKNRVYTISCSSWLNEQLNNNLHENPMPSGLSYDVEVNIDDSSNDSAANSTSANKANTANATDVANSTSTENSANSIDAANTANSTKTTNNANSLN